MLSALEAFFIVGVSVAAAVGCLLLFRRYWLSRRHSHNDIIGWQITFLATTYAVIVAFMLADVWKNYQAAEENTESEASAALNIYRSAQGLPSPQKEQLSNLSRRYCQVMIQEEWPAMTKGSFSQLGSTTEAALWQTVTDTNVQNLSEQAVLNRTLADLTDLSEHRRIRQLQSRSGMPFIFWVTLIAGAAMMIVYTCLFDIEQMGLHVMHVVGTTFIITLLLVTIADIDAPYGGALRIQPTNFVLTLQSMNNHAPQK